MEKIPYVTIIIPYKNNLKYLFPAIKSIFKQSYKNYKIIIIYDNDNKSDLDKIKNFLNTINTEKKSVKIVVNQNSLGAGYARNIGIKKSKTKYIAFLDSDDLWKKNKLKTQIHFMEKNKQVFSHSSYYVINSKNKIISKREAKPEITFDQLIKSCDIGLSTVIVNLYFIKKYDLYFPKIKTKEDFVLWLKIIAKIKIIKGINKELSYYRKVNNSLSSNKLRSLVNGYKVYKKYMEYNFIKSIYYLFILSINSFKKNIISKL
jgi:teichuronic acid biosynthesis glycosyltransferase TuaG